MSVFAGLLLIAPLWLVAKEYIVYGITSLALLFGMLHVRNFPGAFIRKTFVRAYMPCCWRHCLKSYASDKWPSLLSAADGYV